MTQLHLHAISLVFAAIVRSEDADASWPPRRRNPRRGQYADIGLQLGNQAGQEISLQNENGLLQTYTTTNSAVATSLSTTQSALDTSPDQRAEHAQQSDRMERQAPISGRSFRISAPAGCSRSSRRPIRRSTANMCSAASIPAVPPMTGYFARHGRPDGDLQSAFSTYLAGLAPPATAATVTATQMQTFSPSPAFTSQFQGAGLGRPTGPRRPAPTSAAIFRRPRRSRRRPTPTRPDSSNSPRAMRC